MSETLDELEARKKQIEDRIKRLKTIEEIKVKEKEVALLRRRVEPKLEDLLFQHWELLLLGIGIIIMFYNPLGLLLSGLGGLIFYSKLKKIYTRKKEKGASPS